MERWVRINCGTAGNQQTSYSHPLNRSDKPTGASKDLPGRRVGCTAPAFSWLRLDPPPSRPRRHDDTAVEESCVCGPAQQ